MALTPGSRLGPYEVAAQIGAGGMGVVYRATDTQLGRQVALKVLPDAVAGDVESVARFEREARTLAALNHPNIAQVFGIEKSNRTLAIAMELVEGPTLADRIARGAVEVHEALSVARQILDALEAAHEQGIVHRDLKPANVKLRDDGTVKVLDFGLAKAMEPSAVPSPAGGSQMPTLTTPALVTGAGVILGTAAYMSPEQARGRTVTKRTDIWAFGCVLYEMLTGRRAFPGDDMLDVLSAVARAEPDWAVLPADLPLAVRRALHRCLDKNPTTRLGDVAAVKFAIEDAQHLATAGGSNAAAAPALWRRALPFVATAVVAAGVGIGWVKWSAIPDTTTVPIVRTVIAESVEPGEMAVSADGMALVYKVPNNPETPWWVRRIDETDAQPLRGLNLGHYDPAFSPDGQWIGFYDESDDSYKRVPSRGGPAQALGAVGRGVDGVVWLSDDTIVFGQRPLSDPPVLAKLNLTSGTVVPLTRLEDAESGHRWPTALPGGRFVLYTATVESGGRPRVKALDLESGAQRVLFSGAAAQYADGRVYFVLDGQLQSVAFDPAALQTTGAPVPVAESVQAEAGRRAAALVTADGSLLYVPPSQEGTGRTLVWVDASGTEEAIAAAPNDYSNPRVSPDASQILVNATGANLDVWSYRLSRQTLDRLTSTPGRDGDSLWAPDGRLVAAFRQQPERGVALASAAGLQTWQRIAKGDFRPVFWTPDARSVAVVALGSASPTNRDAVALVDVEGDHAVTFLDLSDGAVGTAAISPDGRWLAYTSNESGTYEVYVRPFPNVASGRVRMSTRGGLDPVWAPTGSPRLYFRENANILEVDVKGDRPDSWPVPRVVLQTGGRYYFSQPGPREFDIDPKTGRFLFSKNAEASKRRLVLAQNFVRGLRVPAGK